MEKAVGTTTTTTSPAAAPGSSDRRIGQGRRVGGAASSREPTGLRMTATSSAHADVIVVGQAERTGRRGVCAGGRRVVCSRRIRWAAAVGHCSSRICSRAATGNACWRKVTGTGWSSIPARRFIRWPGRRNSSASSICPPTGSRCAPRRSSSRTHFPAGTRSWFRARPRSSPSPRWVHCRGGAWSLMAPGRPVMR